MEKLNVLLVGAPDPEHISTLRALERAARNPELILLDLDKHHQNMNVETGEIKMLTEEQVAAEQAILKADGKEPLKPLANPPSPKCKKCYGRGHLGKNVITRKMIPCPCTQKKKKSALAKAPVSWPRGK